MPPLKVPSKGWFTPQELGKAIGRSPRTITRHVKSKLLKANQAVSGGEIRIYPPEAEKYLAPK